MVRFIFSIFIVWIAISSQASGTDGNLTLAGFVITGKSPVNQFKLKFDQTVQQTILFNRSTMGNVGQSRIRLTIPVYQIRCDNSMITKDFRDMVCMKDYPEIVLDFHTGKLSTLRLGNTQTMAFNLTIAQITKPVSASIVSEYDKDRGIFHLQGKFLLDMKDFGLKPPAKFFGLIKVSDDVDIVFILIFVPGLNEMNVISDIHAANQ